MAYTLDPPEFRDSWEPPHVVHLHGGGLWHPGRPSTPADPPRRRLAPLARLVALWLEAFGWWLYYGYRVRVAPGEEIPTTWRSIRARFCRPWPEIRRRMRGLHREARRVYHQDTLGRRWRTLTLDRAFHRGAPSQPKLCGAATVAAWNGATLDSILAGLGIPRDVFERDLEGVSYANGRIARIDRDRLWEGLARDRDVEWSLLPRDAAEWARQNHVDPAIVRAWVREGLSVPPEPATPRVERE